MLYGNRCMWIQLSELKTKGTHKIIRIHTYGSSCLNFIMKIEILSTEKFGEMWKNSLIIFNVNTLTCTGIWFTLSHYIPTSLYEECFSLIRACNLSKQTLYLTSCCKYDLLYVKTIRQRKMGLYITVLSSAISTVWFKHILYVYSIYMCYLLFIL